MAGGLAGRVGVTRVGSFGAARLLGCGVMLRRDGCGIVLRRDDEASVCGAADAAGDRAGDAERMAGYRPLHGKGKRSATESGRDAAIPGSGRVTDEVAARLVPGSFKHGVLTLGNLHVLDKFVVDASRLRASHSHLHCNEGHEPICLRLTHLAD